MTPSPNPRIYFDHAATGWPKPEAVYLAMDRFARECGAASGRGAYASGAVADKIVASCRRRLARLVRAVDPNHIAFFCNGTTALNAAILGTVRRGDHVVTTAIEHNSILRPLESLRQSHGVAIDIVPCDRFGRVGPEAVLQRVTPQTRLVAISHASNVTGTVQDVARLGEALAPTETLLLCDAAQALGYLPIDMQQGRIDLLASPGHKGACGPLGTALLALSPKALAEIRPTVFGGTGTRSESPEMPDAMPARLEPGNLNVTALAGWDAGLQWLAEHSADAQADGALSDGALGDGASGSLVAAAMADFCDQVGSLGTVRLLGPHSPSYPESPSGQPPLQVVSLAFDRVEVGLVGSLLDTEFGIEVRTGLHCSPLIHRFIGTAPHGTLRISGGHGTTAAHWAAAAAALREILGELSGA
jgi:selenocysteine lyase/cysteine desulfurase